MKLKILVLAAGILSLAETTNAQVTTDSMNTLKTEKQRLKLANTINENRLKLATMENKVADRQKDLDDATERSNKAVKKNQSAADDLSDDKDSKSKVRDARRAASNAESAAKDARKAAERLDDLNKDIEKMKKRIADDEKKLAAINGTGK